MEKQKKVSFKPRYLVLKWSYGEKCEKSSRKKEEIKQGDTIEQEVVIEHEDNFKNKKEICSDRIRNRDKLSQGISNPFMINNNYLDDLLNQDTYLRPKDSNMKN
tara:strand:+ start:5122 stop:5433 length:312 start_codon:yes stop_codon:yes gene_type:complete